MNRFPGFPDRSDRTVAGISILLAQMRAALRTRHYSLHTEKAYLAWVGRLVAFCGRRHPIDLAAADVSQFLLRVAGRGHASASTQSQAASAIAFLFLVHSCRGKPELPSGGTIVAPVRLVS